MIMAPEFTGAILKNDLNYGQRVMIWLAMKKREKERKSKQTKVEVKEIRLGPNTDEHDFEFKKNHAMRFLQSGCKVKVEVFFRGRTIIYKDQGEIMLLKFASQLEEYGKVEVMPKLEGKRMQMLLAPISKKK